MPPKSLLIEGVALSVEKTLKSVLSPRQPLQPILTSLSRLTSQQQQFVVHWIDVFTSSNIELAYYFANLSEGAFDELSEEGVHRWMINALSIYDQEGLYPAVRELKDVKGYQERVKRHRGLVQFEEVVGVLTPYLRGLAGRELEVKTGESTHTDTSTIYLPAQLAVYESKEKNRCLYKAMASFLWAQTWFGTFKKKNYSSPSLLKRLEKVGNGEDINTAQQVFLVLENVRLMACIKRELPGLYREMGSLHLKESNNANKDSTWNILTEPLKQEYATVDDTLLALKEYLALHLSYPPIPYLGVLKLSEVEASILDRKEQVTTSLLDQMEKGFVNKNTLEEILEGSTGKQPTDQQAGLGGEQETELGELLNSLSQDIESLEPDWLDQLKHAADTTKIKKPNQEQSTSPQRNKFDPNQQEVYYDEWDHQRQQYRESWCRLVEKPVHKANTDDFQQETLHKHRHLVARVRKVFEVIKDQGTLLKNQVDGEEIDIDAVISSKVNQQAGEEITDRYYMRKNRKNRSFAVLLLIDLSGSTKGWINQLERESLLLIIEALEILGDQYAIYGFSGLTRQRCEIYPIKRFSDDNKAETQSKIAAMNAKDYTRMGVAIRHSTEQLKKIQARHKLLLVISDGKPDDYDGYKGEYGLEDTRRSLDEAQNNGIHSFAITIDQQAQQYLPRLFGQNRYTILNNIDTLPVKLADIYRRITH